MRLCIVMILSLGLLSAADAQDDAIKEEMKKLEGTWTRIYVEGCIEVVFPVSIRREF